MPARYTYLAVDIRTNTILGELPLRGVDFTLKINGAGDLNAKLSFGDTRLSSATLKALTTTRRTALYVERDGALIWGGPIWKRTWSSSASELTIVASEWWSWFMANVIASDQSFGAVDQATVVNAVLTAAMGISGGNIGVILNTPATGSLIVPQTWSADRNIPWAQPVTDLASQDAPAGFDFAIDVAYDAGKNCTATFNLGTPRRGRVAADTRLVFDLPGNLVDYTDEENALASGTTVIAAGAGTLTARVSDLTSIAGGDVATTRITQYKSVTDPTVLSNLAASDLARYSDPVRLPSVNAKPDQLPLLGSYIVGDEARIDLTDAWHPAGTSGAAGYSADWRITEIKVTPQDTADEQIALTLGPVV